MTAVSVGCILLVVIQIVSTEGRNAGMTTAEKLVLMRGARSRAEVAKAIGVSVAALGLYEQGRRVPRDETKKALAKLYDTTVEYLFFTEE